MEKVLVKVIEKTKIKNEVDLQINDLIFEVTRRCNMNCAHCLRGNVQGCDISDKVIEKALDGVTKLDCVTFSGGEPSLNVPAIKKIVDVIITKKISCRGFFVATNGLIYSEELITVLNKLYLYCIDCSYGVNFFIEGMENSRMIDGSDIFSFNKNDINCSLTVSRDPYHDPIPLMNFIKYSLLPYFTDEKDNSDVSVEAYNKRIISTGRAAEYGLGTPRASATEFSIENVEYVSGKDNGHFFTTYIVDMIYVNALGNVYADCDISFEEQDDDDFGYICGSVFDETLGSMVSRQYAKEEE